MKQAWSRTRRPQTGFSRPLPGFSIKGATTADAALRDWHARYVRQRCPGVAPLAQAKLAGARWQIKRLNHAAEVPKVTSGESNHSAKTNATRRGVHSEADAVDVVRHAAVAAVFDQAVDVGLETREHGVEVARELEIVDDLAVDAFARDKQRDAWRIRRQQHRRDPSVELVDRHPLDLPVRHPC